MVPTLLERPIEQRPLPRVPEEVEAQAQVAEGLSRFRESLLFDGAPREGEAGVLASESLESGEGLVAEDLVLLPEARQQEIHRPL